MSECNWIDVNERLPEYDFFTVLVAVCPPCQTNSTHIGYAVWGGWMVLDEKGNHADFITHWQPLPSPPTNIKE